MKIIRLDNRGQLSAEYLLLFVVILVLFLFMINNFIGPAINANNNVTAVSNAKVVVDSIADAVNIVYANGPGAKRTVDVNVPWDMTLTFDSTNHVVKTDVNNLNYTLPNNTVSTSKSANASLNYNKGIDPLTLSKGWHKVQIYWNNTVNPTEIEVTQIS